MSPETWQLFKWCRADRQVDTSHVVFKVLSVKAVFGETAQRVWSQRIWRSLGCTEESRWVTCNDSSHGFPWSFQSAICDAVFLACFFGSQEPSCLRTSFTDRRRPWRHWMSSFGWKLFRLFPVVSNKLCLGGLFRPWLIGAVTKKDPMSFKGLLYIFAFTSMEFYWKIVGIPTHQHV